MGGGVCGCFGGAHGDGFVLWLGEYRGNGERGECGVGGGFLGIGVSGQVIVVVDGFVGLLGSPGAGGSRSKCGGIVSVV